MQNLKAALIVLVVLSGRPTFGTDACGPSLTASSNSLKAAQDHAELKKTVREFALKAHSKIDEFEREKKLADETAAFISDPQAKSRIEFTRDLIDRLRLAVKSFESGDDGGHQSAQAYNQEVHALLVRMINNLHPAIPTEIHLKVLYRNSGCLRTFKPNAIHAKKLAAIAFVHEERVKLLELIMEGLSLSHQLALAQAEFIIPRHSKSQELVATSDLVQRRRILTHADLESFFAEANKAEAKTEQALRHYLAAIEHLRVFTALINKYRELDPESQDAHVRLEELKSRLYDIVRTDLSGPPPPSSDD